MGVLKAKNMLFRDRPLRMVVVRERVVTADQGGGAGGIAEDYGVAVVMVFKVVVDTFFAE